MGWVVCKKCGASSAALSDDYEEADCQQEAIAAWNRRVDARQLALKTRVCPMCEDCPDGCPVETPKDSRNIVTNAADLIESLQAQLAASQRRERAAVEDMKTMEKIEYFVQAWLEIMLDWVDVGRRYTFDDAEKFVKNRKKKDGINRRVYRIVRATTTYEVMEEAK